MSTLEKAVTALKRTFVLAPASDAQASQERTIRRRGLRVGSVGLLVDCVLSGEIIEHIRLFPLPRAPSWCRGLINLRGRLLPAFDLHEYLSLRKSAQTRQWWFVLGTDDYAAAFPIDALPQTLTLSESTKINVALALPERLRDHVGLAYRCDGQLWFELRHRELLAQMASTMAA